MRAVSWHDKERAEPYAFLNVGPITLRLSPMTTHDIGVAARLPARRWRGGPAHHPHTLPARLRPREAPALRPMARHPAPARGRAVRRAAGELEYVELDGAPGWTLAGDTSTPRQPHRGIRLLPYFDAYVVAGQPRERLYPGADAARALSPAGQAGNYPVLLVDGVVGGVWHQRRSGRRLAITVEPVGELTATQRRQLDDEVELVGAVMEAKPTLTVGTVTVGPHA